MDQLKSLYWFAISGVAGAFVMIGVRKDKTTPAEVIIFIVSGMLTATFIAPLVFEWSGLKSQRAANALGFIVGAGWLYVLNRGLAFIKNAPIPTKDS